MGFDLILQGLSWQIFRNVQSFENVNWSGFVVFSGIIMIISADFFFSSSLHTKFTIQICWCCSRFTAVLMILE